MKYFRFKSRTLCAASTQVPFAEERLFSFRVKYIKTDEIKNRRVYDSYSQLMQ